MVAEWPPVLPFFVVKDGMQRTGPQGAVIRTQMDAGPDKVRRRTTAAPMRLTGTTPILSRPEIASFEAFFADTLGMGALTFTARDPISCTVRTFRFFGSYTITPAGRGGRVTADLEILP